MYQQTNFFNKKKTIGLSACFFILVVLIGLTLWGVLKIDFSALARDISNAAATNKLFAISIIVLLVAPLIRTMNIFFSYMYELKRRKIVFSTWELLMISYIYYLIIFITPSSIGGEPWLMYWLRRKGIPLNEANAFVLYSSTVQHFGAMLITWPSFIYFVVNIYNNINDYQFIIWFASIGISLEAIVLVSFVIMSFVPRVQYWISLIFNLLLAKFKLKHKTRKQINAEYKTKKIFKSMMIEYYKNWKFDIFLFFLSIFNNALIYILFFFSVNICSENVINFFDSFNAVNISVTANNFIPLPGSEGSLEVLLQKILHASFHHNDLSVQTASNSIFIWRTFTNYITALIGCLFLVYYIYSIVKNKKDSHLNYGTKNNKILIIQNRSHNTIGGIENYNFNLIKIFKDKGFDVYEMPLVRDSDVDQSKFITKSLNPHVISMDEKYYDKTKWFEKIDSVNPLKQYAYMTRFIKNSKRMVKEHLKTNSYDLIIDSSFFGFKYLFNNENYVWIQHNSKKSRNGMIYNNFLMNFFGLIGTKLLGVENTFKYCQNVVLYDKENENDINIKGKSFYKIPLFYDGKWINSVNKKKDKVIFIGRLDKHQKRCDLLIKLAPLLNKPIYVYGEGEYKDKIMNSNNLIYKGTFNHNDINKIFKDKELLLLLSNHEGFSFTLVESLSNATPIILRDTFPSAKFFVNNNKNGLLIKKNISIKKMAAIINGFLETNNYKNSMNCFKFAKNNFSFEKFKKSWLDLHQDLSKK